MSNYMQPNVNNLQMAHNLLLQKNLTPYRNQMQRMNQENYNIESQQIELTQQKNHNKSSNNKKFFNITGKDIWDSAKTSSNSKMTNKYNESVNIFGQSTSKLNQSNNPMPSNTKFNNHNDYRSSNIDNF